MTDKNVRLIEPTETMREAYVDMMAFEGPHDFLDNLAMGQVGGRQSSPTVHLYSIYARWRKRREARRQ